MLRTVLVHRPGLELERLTPRNKDDLLFDDVLWVKRARQEHDAFADALAERGVEVLEVRHLLAETLDAGRRATEAARPHASPRPGSGRGSGAALREWLGDAAVDRAGRAADRRHRLRRAAVRRHVAQLRSRGAATSCSRRCPNHLFTRDTSAWVYGGVCVNHMAKPARVREAVHLDAIYRHHPRFADAEFARWSDGAAGRPVARGRRRARDRQRLRAGRHGRAHAAGRRRAAGRPAVRGRRRPAGDRARPARATLGDAPRHRHDDGRRATRSRSTRTSAPA